MLLLKDSHGLYGECVVATSRRSARQVFFPEVQNFFVAKGLRPSSSSTLALGGVRLARLHKSGENHNEVVGRILGTRNWAMALRSFQWCFLNANLNETINLPAQSYLEQSP